jgi:hypothetical protein
MLGIKSVKQWVQWLFTLNTVSAFGALFTKYTGCFQTSGRNLLV